MEATELAEVEVVERAESEAEVDLAEELVVELRLVVGLRNELVVVRLGGAGTELAALDVDWSPAGAAGRVGPLMSRLARSLVSASTGCLVALDELEPEVEAAGARATVRRVLVGAAGGADMLDDWCW